MMYGAIFSQCLKMCPKMVKMRKRIYEYSIRSRFPEKIQTVLIESCLFATTVITNTCPQKLLYMVDQITWSIMWCIIILLKHTPCICERWAIVTIIYHWKPNYYHDYYVGKITLVWNIFYHCCKFCWQTMAVTTNDIQLILGAYNFAICNMKTLRFYI